MHAEKPEDEAAERSLYDGNYDVALHRGAHHDGEPPGELTLMLGATRQGGAHAHINLVAVAQQEKQAIEHYGKAYEELERVLADVERLKREDLAHAREAGRNPCLYCVHVGKAEALEQTYRPCWQDVQYLPQIARETHVPLAHPLVYVRSLLHQEDDEKGDGHDDQHYDYEQRRECSHGVVVAQGAGQPPTERGEQYGEHGSPQNGAEERPQDERERCRYSDQQPNKAAVFERAQASYDASAANGPDRALRHSRQHGVSQP